MNEFLGNDEHLITVSISDYVALCAQFDVVIYVMFSILFWEGSGSENVGALLQMFSIGLTCLLGMFHFYGASGSSNRAVSWARSLYVAPRSRSSGLSFHIPSILEL